MALRLQRPSGGRFRCLFGLVDLLIFVAQSADRWSFAPKSHQHTHAWCAARAQRCESRFSRVSGLAHITQHGVDDGGADAKVGVVQPLEARLGGVDETAFSSEADDGGGARDVD